MRLTRDTNPVDLLGREVHLSPRSLEQAVGTVVAVRDSGATVRLDHREVDVPWSMVRVDSPIRYRSLPGQRHLPFDGSPEIPAAVRGAPAACGAARSTTPAEHKE